MVTFASGDKNHDGEVKLNQNYVSKDSLGTDYSYKHKLNWPNIIFFSVLHILGLWGLGIALSGGISFIGFLWGVLLYAVSTTNTTVGAHRYYSHKTFKAAPLLRAIFILIQTCSGQYSMYVWCRDHRLHHRYSDTDADPHNSNRGFFFSHIGWLISKKHPCVIQYGKSNDVSDLEADWMVMFQRKYYILLYIPIAIMIPVLVPAVYFGDTWLNSFLYAYGTRYLLTFHCACLINSVAHLYGTRPYDKNINPVECWYASFATFGEGWHNYHHTYPWDYNAAELPMPFNFSASLIRFFEKIGLAYDLKTVPQDMVLNAAQLKKVYTLVFVCTDRQILLGLKKRGFGVNKWNGFGGKVELSESIVDAAVRELNEECCLTVKASDLKNVGHLEFTFEGESVMMDVRVFTTNIFKGTPQETEEMNPKWYNYDQIPYNNMWPDDRYWIPYMLKGKPIYAKFHYKGYDTILNYKIDVVESMEAFYADKKFE